MKKHWILSALVAAMFSVSSFAQDDAVLMTINGKDITKSEFEYIYNKNNRQQIELKNLDEYLPLFINYKLKVDAAEQAGIDTTAAFIQELNGYREELARPYLTDLETEERLLREAYDNYCKNVELSHILIMIEPGATAEDKAAALAKAQEVAAKAIAGEDFTQLAAQYSEDPGSKDKGGYLGYIKGGRLIYPFEKVAFAMKAGEVSQPVETQFGYHIIKVHSVRPDRGDRLCSHIFLMVPQGATPEVEAQKQAEAQAIYNDLLAGADFAQMARDKSEDRANASQGGLLPWCTTGDLVKEFEDAAFSLNVGEFSAPIRSRYGYHIVMLNDKRDVRSFDEMRYELTQRMSRDERGTMVHRVFLENIKNKYNYAVNESAISAFLSQCPEYPDSTFIAALNKEDIVLATYDNNTITTFEIANSLSKHRVSPGFTSAQMLDREIERQATLGLIELETASLVDSYPEYRNLINEYRDGMLLFEISNREVWAKASVDTDGLAQFFKKNKKNYNWERPRFKGFVVSCANDSIAKEVRRLIKKTDDDKVVALIDSTFNNDSVVNVFIERGLFAEGDNKYVDELIFKGAKASRDESLPIVFVSGKKLKNPECYLDVRGQVTADYQEYLEKLWIERLNREATIEINEDVLKTIN